MELGAELFFHLYVFVGPEVFCVRSTVPAASLDQK